MDEKLPEEMSAIHISPEFRQKIWELLHIPQVQQPASLNISVFNAQLITKKKFSPRQITGYRAQYRAVLVVTKRRHSCVSCVRAQKWYRPVKRWATVDSPSRAGFWHVFVIRFLSPFFVEVFVTGESKGNLYYWPKFTVCLLSTLSLFVLTHAFLPFNLQVGRFYKC